MNDWQAIAKEFFFNKKEMAFEGPIQRMAEEILKLRRIIAKELTENDDLGSEFVYVNELRTQLQAYREYGGHLRKDLDHVDNVHGRCDRLAKTLELAPPWEVKS